MPELPEIKAHSERLHASHGGAVIEQFRVLHPSALKTFDPRPDHVVGSAVSRIRHRGKHILIDVDSPESVTFVVHLMQGGRLRSDRKRAPRPRRGMARWEFADGRALLLTEAGTEHRAGVWLVRGDPESVAPLAGLGPDADTISREELATILDGEAERVHGFLRNQKRIAGIGRLLANEILHGAGISPFAISTKLSDEQVARLHTAMKHALDRALAHERGLSDIGRSSGRPSNVHHRIGQPCLVCADTILAVEYRRYTIAYCPRCQTNGRRLADNTTSKFLK